jgi:2-oxoglutarate dehydrogenase E1 component
MPPQNPWPGWLHAGFLEGMYAEYLRDPSSVTPDWRRYFESLRAEDGGAARWQPGPSFRPRSVFNPAPRDGYQARRETEVAALQDRVDQLVRNYRVRGHIAAHLDPLGRPRPQPPELDPAFYGFTAADMQRRFSIRTIRGGEMRTLAEILQSLRNTYCRYIGVQFMHIDDLGIRHWLQDRMESTENRRRLSRPEQIRIFTRLTDAVIFEEFIQKKYVGAKSFSLEGSESLIPLLDLAIETAGEQEIDEIVLGMAHRGRLNVLANILAKHPRQIFREFEDVDPHLYSHRGDVKYHLGHSSDWITASGRCIHLSLCFNPSHLEFVNPVAIGRMRAKQDRVGDREGRRGLVLLIHGDAAFAGEGMVQETLNLSELPAYRIGGTVHVIVNNQIGFTTDPEEARSSLYASSVARMLQIPLFLVNGEDPEAVAQVIRLAMEFRAAFQRDVVIEMYGYRRHGHNEGDEPSFTQPLLYRAIENRPPVRESYLEHLLELGGVTREEADRIAAERHERLEHALSAARSDEYQPPPPKLAGIWSDYVGGPESAVEDVDTGADPQRLAALLEAQTRLPADFHLHPKLRRWIRARQEMAEGRRPLDWAAAESLAFASLAVEGHPIRMSGQDSERGTFSQRHVVLHDYEDGHTYMPLQHLAPDQARVEIYNSPLSEAGVLGFEYGYSLDAPGSLVLWEAQFGDFVNAAQVIVDQFIASAEDKWHRLSGIVLLLPHGFEGQGPEHSSARLERFLVLAAEDNIQVVYPSTPAQFFHCLRRQVVRRWRKPLVVLTPKSLLRHPKVVSSLDELGSGRFQRVLPDREAPAGKVRRLLLCSAKLYYELAERRERLGRQDVAIVRLEQFYQLPEQPLREALEPYPEGIAAVWVQEGPINMGPWRYLRARLGESLFGRFPFSVVARPSSASPATGSASSHRMEQEQLLERAFHD